MPNDWHRDCHLGKYVQTSFLTEQSEGFVSVPGALLPAAWSHCKFCEAYCIYAHISCTPDMWTGPALRRLSTSAGILLDWLLQFTLFFTSSKSVPEEVISLPLAMFFIFLFSYEILLYTTIRSDFGNTLTPLCPFLSDESGYLLSFPSFRMQLNQLFTCSGLGFGDVATRPGCAID